MLAFTRVEKETAAFHFLLTCLVFIFFASSHVSTVSAAAATVSVALEIPEPGSQFAFRGWFLGMIHFLLPHWLKSSPRSVLPHWFGKIINTTIKINNLPQLHQPFINVCVLSKLA